MDYLIFGSIVVILIFMIIRYASKRNLLRTLEELRIDWGKPKNESFDFPRIKRYSNLVEQAGFHTLSEQTIIDIDFEKLFMFIDRTTSKVGQQFLYRKLLEPTDEREDKDRILKQLFTEDGRLREEVQLELLKLSSDDAYQIALLFGEQYLKKPKWFKLLYIDIAILFLLALASIKFPALLILMIIPVMINILLHYWNKSKAFQTRRAIPQLNLLIRVTESISSKNKMFRDDSVSIGIHELRPIQKISSLISFEGTGLQSELSQLGTYILDLIKATLLIEIFSLFKIVEELEAKKSHVQTLFDFIGKIDSAISVVSLRSGVSKTCEPEFLPVKKALTSKNMYHPLVPKCIGNDFLVNDKSILITGSNNVRKINFFKSRID